MKCPRCERAIEPGSNSCSHCDTQYGVAALEEYAHLEYLQNRLFAWNASGDLSPELTARLLASTRQELRRIKNTLGLEAPPSVEASRVELSDTSASQATETEAPLPHLQLEFAAEPGADPVHELLAPAQSPAMPEPQAPPPTPIATFLDDLVDRLIDAVRPSGTSLSDSLAGAEPVTDAFLAGPDEIDGSQSRTATGQRSRRWLALPDIQPVFTGRDFSWKQVGTYLLSERTMHALLALGTFLILASGFVISTLNPTRLPPLWHLCAVAVTTAIFYSVGYLVRFRLHLSITGSTLMAIGGAFIPLTVATLGREELLNWEPGAIWLAASLISLPVFLCFHMLLRDRAFALFTALAGASELLALLNWLGLSGEWAAATLVALAIGYLRLGRRIRGEWSVLAWALFWVAQTTVPVILAGLKGSLTFPILWQVVAGQEPGGSLGWGVVTAWWLGVLFYWLCSNVSGRQRYQFATAWTIPFAYLFTIDAVRVDPAWYNFWLALMPAGYALLSLWRGRHQIGTSEAKLREMLADPICQAGLAATVEVALWPNQSVLARGPSLVIVALTYASYAFQFRGILPLRYVASYLLPLAVGLSLGQLAALGLPWFQPPWQGLALVALAACYLLPGWRIRLGRSSPANYRALLKDPIYQVALALTIASAFWPPATRGSLALTYLALAVLFAAATHLLRMRATAYVSAAFLPLSYGLATAPLALDGTTTTLGSAVLATAMLAAAEALARRSGEAARPLWETMAGIGEWRSRFASPLFLAGYSTAVVAGALCFGAFVRAQGAGPGTLVEGGAIVAGVVIVAAATVSSVTRRSSLLLYPAVVLSLVPYLAFAGHVAHWLGRPPSQGGAALLLSVLAAAYVGIAAVTDRFGGHYSKPAYLAGYALSVLAMALAAGDRFPRVVVVGIALFVYAWSAWRVHRGRHPSFEWLIKQLTAATRTVPPAVNSLFLYLAAWLFPLWVALAISLATSGAQIALYGVAVSVLAPIYVVLGRRFERVDREYRWPWYLAGYALSTVGPFLAWLDAVTPIQVGQVVILPQSLPLVFCLLASVALYAASAWTFLRTVWLWPVAVLFPAWVLLAMRLWMPSSPPDPYGVALAVVAAVYVVVGWRLSGFGSENQEPWFIVAYVLSGLGPLLTLSSAMTNTTGLKASDLGSAPFLISLSISTLLYLAAARPLRQPDWLYAGAALLPLLLVATLQRLEASTPTYGMALLLLSLAYVVAGTAIHHGSLRLVRYPITGPTRPYALPFFIAAHGVCVLALGHLLTQGGQVVVNGFLLGSLVYAGSAFVFRQHRFVTPAAITLAIVYVYRLSVSGPLWRWETPDMLLGIAAFLAVGQLLRTRLGYAWGKAFFVIAQVATPLMILVAGSTSATWYQSWWGAALVFAVSTRLFRDPRWLYPAILSAVGGYLTTLEMLRLLVPFNDYYAVTLIGPLWLLAWIAHGVTVKSTRSEGTLQSPLPGTERIWSHRWASPFAWCFLIVLGISAIGSATDPGKGLLAALSYGFLVAPFAVLWAGELEAWCTLGFAVVALGQWHRLVVIPGEEAAPRFAALSLVFAVLAIVARATDAKGMVAWRRPLSWGPVALGAFTLVVAAGMYAGRPSQHTLQMLAATVSICGLTMIALGFAHQLRFLGYLGVAAVEGGYMLELSRMQVDQPQAFALPAGIYLLAIAFLEWRRGEDTRLKKRLEQTGLTLLLGVSLIQAVGQLSAGYDRYFYDTFLFCECLAVLALGAALRWKRTFLWSINALVIDVLIMLADPIRAMNTWYLLAVTGTIMIAIVVFAEQRRQQIPGWMDEWRQRLESWD
jgi:hypothetical protein